MTLTEPDFNFSSLEKAFTRKDYASCFPVLDRVKELLGRDPRQVPLLARIAGVAGRFQLEKVIWRWGLGKLGPDIALLWGLAGSYLSSGKPFQARKLLLQALKMSAGTREEGKTHCHLSTVYARLRLFQTAAQHLQRAGAPLGKEATFFDQGLLYFMQERFPEAGEMLQRAIRHEPGRESAYILLAQLACQQQEWPAAETWLSAGLRHSPQSPLLLFHLATTYWLLEEKEAFLSTLPTVESISPGADFLPILYWLKAHIHYREREWPAVRASLDKEFPCLKTNPFEKSIGSRDLHEQQDRIYLPLKPQLQRYNQCVPCALSIVLDYHRVAAGAAHLGQMLMEDRGTPLDRVYDWLEREGYGLITFQAGPEQVKEVLRAELPLLMLVSQGVESHVTIIHGYDDGLQCFFLRDPSHLYPLALPYDSYDESFLNSHHQAVVIVPPHRRAALYPMRHWDEPALRDMARCFRAIKNKQESTAAQIMNRVASRLRGQPCLAQFQVDYYPGYTGEEEFAEAAGLLWSAPQQRHFFRLRVINALLRSDWPDEATGRLDSLEREEFDWYARFIQARLQLSLGKNEEAVKAGTKVLQRNPHFTEAYLLMGEALLQQENYAEAERYLQWALELEPGSSKVYAYLGEYHRCRKNYQQAEGFFERALAIDPGDCWAWECRGLCCYDQELYATALRHFRMSVSADPRRPWAYAYLARTYEEWSGNLDEAVRWLKQGLAKAGSHNFLLSNLGRILVMQERYAEALPYLRQALKSKDDPELAPLLACCLRETGAIPEAKAVMESALERERQSSYLLAHAARDSSLEGQGEKALEQLARALELEPTYLWALDQLVELCCREGKPAYGLQILTKIMEKHGPQEALLSRTGYLWEISGDTAKAKAYYHRALEHDPAAAYPLLNLAGLQELEEEWSTAEESYRRLLERRESPAEACLGLARVYRSTGREDGAVELLKKAIADCPGTPECREALLDLLYHQNKLDDARRAALDARLDARQQSIALVQVGSCLFQDRRYREAAGWFQDAVSRDEKNESAHIALALTFLREEHYNRAGEVIEKAYELFPDNPEVLFWYGDIMSSWWAEPLKALTAYEKLYQIYEEREQKAYALAMQGYCLAVIGREKEGRERFEAALQLDPLQEIAAANLARENLRQKNYEHTVKVLLPVVEAGRGAAVPHLLTNFMQALHHLRLPGQIEWLEQVWERLDHLRTAGSGEKGEYTLLLKQARELSVALGDSRLLPQRYRGGFLTRGALRLKIALRRLTRPVSRFFSKNERLAYAGAAALFSTELIIRLKVLLDPESGSQDIGYFVVILILCILILLRQRWAMFISLILLIPVSLLLLLGFPLSIRSMLVEQDYLEVLFFIIVCLMLILATLFLLLYVRRTRRARR